MNKMILHDSSIRHATGQAIYIDDMPAQENLLHGVLVLSVHRGLDGTVEQSHQCTV